MIKIGLDLHGVILDLPDTFKFICESVIKNGGEIHIITGGRASKATEELNEIGMFLNTQFTHIFSVMDYHISAGTKVTGYNEEYCTPEFPDEDWDRTKAEYCERTGINLHIDDSLLYNNYFNTPFARLFTHSNTPKKNKPERLME